MERLLEDFVAVLLREASSLTTPVLPSDTAAAAAVAAAAADIEVADEGVRCVVKLGDIKEAGRALERPFAAVVVVAWLSIVSC